MSVKIFVVVFVSLFFVACKNKSVGKNDPKAISAENAALKIIKALKENDFNTFKSLCINANEFAENIKGAKIDPEMKVQALGDFKDALATFTTELLTKEAFEKFRKDIEEKYGDSFWKTVVILENPNVINGYGLDSINFQESDVNFKLLFEKDTLIMPLKTFCLQKNGWAFFGNLRVITNKQDLDEDVMEFDDEDTPPANIKIDTSKGIKKFDDGFENLKDDPNDE